LVQGNQLQSLFQIALQGTNTIYGSSGNDVILTYNGNNTVYGGGGSDLITGGSGFDTLVLHGNKANYTITDQAGAGVTVSDTVPNRDGTAQTISFSYLKFADHGVVLTPNATTDAAEIAMLYAAALGRAPDLAGLSGWVTAFSNNVSASVKAQGPVVALAEVSGGYNGSQSIAAGFTGSAEFQHNYGTLDNGAFVTLLYNNVLGRAPDQTGYSGWVNALNAGAWTKEMVLVGFATSSENYGHVQAEGWLMQY
jgi:serralysin